MKGIDCAVPLTVSTAKAAAAAGYVFACRYLVPAAYAWKRLTRAEAEAITGAGMMIVSVYETVNNRAASGAAAGKADGAAALLEAQAVGQPAGSVVYFAVDYDAQASDFDAIEAYLKAARAQIPAYRIGVYGSYAVVEEMARRGAAQALWQTYSWSRGRLSSRANIRQYSNDQKLAGMTVDFNESFGGEGWWNTMASAFKDVPDSYWASSAIERAVKENLMGGYPDGTFKPDQPLTRAEMAVILSRLLDRG